MLQHSLEKENVLALAEAIIRELDPQLDVDRLLISKGLQLYREGRVYNVSFNGDTLIGTVQQEGDTFEAAISLQNSSYCDCFDFGCCEHQVAVLFYAASSFGQVGEITRLFKEKGKPQLPKLKTARQLLQSSSSYEELNFDSWLHYFEQQFTSFKQEQNKYSYRKMYLLMNIFEEFYMKLRRQAPRSGTLQELFLLTASLFCLERLLETAEEYSQEQEYSYFSPTAVAHRFIEEIEVHTENLQELTVPLAFEPLLFQLTHITRSLLFSHTLCLQERLFVYRYLWQVLLSKEDWLKQEQAILLDMEPSVIQTLATAHLLFLQLRDREAMMLLEEQDDMLVGFYFYWIEELCEAEQWDRVHSWLSFAEKKLKRYLLLAENQFLKQDIVRLFLSAYSYYASHTKEYSSFEHILHELLPYSALQYEVYLLDRSEYKRWVELRLYVGFDTLEGLKDHIKEVEKHDREAVLPLYHQGVIDAIALKNRQAYKQAVRYLKKLRTHYKKLKRTEEWDRYIKQLTLSYSRLRALQEELRKGKLLDES